MFNQAVSCILPNLPVHYRIHNSRQFVLILSHVSPVRDFPSRSFTILRTLLANPTPLCPYSIESNVICVLKYSSYIT
jgi:hypothetical protein